jgi:hypothetical protein
LLIKKSNGALTIGLCARSDTSIKTDVLTFQFRCENCGDLQLLVQDDPSDTYSIFFDPTLTVGSMQFTVNPGETDGVVIGRMLKFLKILI